MKNHNFSLRAFALAVATLFVTTGCGDDSTSDETGGGNTPAPAATAIKIAVSDIQGTSATVATTPNSNDLTYMVDVATKEEFEGYASAEAFAAAVVEAIKAEAAEENTALEVYLVEEGLLNQGGQRSDFAGLETSTDYVAYAFGLSSEGVITTGVSTAAFTTLESDPEPEKVTFTITASEITATSVSVKVTPSDNTVDYYWDILPTELVESMTEAELVAALEQMFENYYGVSLYAACYTGEDSYTFDDLDPGTEYTIFAFTYTEDGEAGELSIQKVSTLEASINITMTPGVYDKTTEQYVNPDTYMSVEIAVANNKTITSLYYYCDTTEEVEGYIESYRGVGNFMADVATYPDFNLEDDLEALNTNGAIAFYFRNRTPDTEYTILLLATDSEGVTSIYRASESTEAAAEASEAYNAWIGDWTVTSAGSLVFTADGVTETNDPISFDITIKAKSLNANYEITGWGVLEDRLEFPCTGAFNNSDGSFSIANNSSIQQWANGLEKIYNISKTSSGNYSMVGGSFDCFTATQAEDGTVTAIGSTYGLSGGGSFTVLVCDYFFTDSTTEQTGWIDFAEEYADAQADKFPTLPYTLTKKTTTTEPEPEPETPETSSLRKSISVPTLSQFSTIIRELKMAQPATTKPQAVELTCDSKELKNAVSGKQSTDKKKLARELLSK